MSSQPALHASGAMWCLEMAQAWGRGWRGHWRKEWRELNSMR